MTDNPSLSLSFSLCIVSCQRGERKRMTTRRERRRTRRRETRVRLQLIRVDVEVDRRSQHRIYNQHDCLTPHNQRPYPYYAGNIVASPFVLPPPRPPVSSFPGAQAGTPLRSFHGVDITWEIRSSPLFSRLSFLSHHLFGYLLGPLPLRAGPHYPDHDSKWDSAGQGRNGHGYIIRDRNNARFVFFLHLGTSQLTWPLLLQSRQCMR